MAELFFTQISLLLMLLLIYLWKSSGYVSASVSSSIAKANGIVTKCFAFALYRIAFGVDICLVRYFCALFWLGLCDYVRWPWISVLCLALTRFEREHQVTLIRNEPLQWNTTAENLFDLKPSGTNRACFRCFKKVDKYSRLKWTEASLKSITIIIIHVSRSNILLISQHFFVVSLSKLDFPIDLITQQQNCIFK